MPGQQRDAGSRRGMGSRVLFWDEGVLVEENRGMVSVKIKQ